MESAIASLLGALIMPDPIGPKLKEKLKIQVGLYIMITMTFCYGHMKLQDVGGMFPPLLAVAFASTILLLQSSRLLGLTLLGLLLAFLLIVVDTLSLAFLTLPKFEHRNAFVLALDTAELLWQAGVILMGIEWLIYLNTLRTTSQFPRSSPRNGSGQWRSFYGDVQEAVVVE